MTGPALRIVLMGQELDPLARGLRARMPQAEVVRGELAPRGQGASDIFVLRVADLEPGENAWRWLEGETRPVVVIGPDRLEVAVEAMRRGAVDYLPDADPMPPALPMRILGAARKVSGRDEAGGLSRAELYQALSGLVHDLNNPLAIISGNLQLLGEVGKTLELDTLVREPLGDMESASQKLAQQLRRLVALRDRLKPR